MKILCWHDVIDNTNYMNIMDRFFSAYYALFKNYVGTWCEEVFSFS